MKMKMKNGLSRIFAAVVYNTLSADKPEFFGGPFNRKHDLPNNITVFIIEIVHRRHQMLFRDENDMNGRLRVYVAERQDIVILVNLRRGYLTRGDLAENAIHKNYLRNFGFGGEKRLGNVPDGDPPPI